MRRKSLLGGARRQQQLQEQDEADRRWSEQQDSAVTNETAAPAEDTAAATPAEAPENELDIPPWLPQQEDGQESKSQLDLPAPSTKADPQEYSALPVTMSDAALPRRREPCQQAGRSRKADSWRMGNKRIPEHDELHEQALEQTEVAAEEPVDEQLEPLGADQHTARQLARSGRLLLLLVLATSLVIALLVG